MARYRKSVTVQYGQVPAALANFPVLLSIATDTDLAANATESGDDIYMTESNGATLVSTEIEKWDSSTGELRLWFKAPSLSSSEDTVFYLYYGQILTDNGRDPADVWSQDYESVYHMSDVDAADYDSLAVIEDGYELPIYNPTTRPAAYYYNGVTYMVYQGDPGGTDNDAYIMKYTHGSKTWSAAVKVGDNALVGDHHGIPSVIVDNSGYIHVFFGNDSAIQDHVGAMKYSISTNPEDITAWTAQTDVGTRDTYSNLVKINDGTIYLFTRYKPGATGFDYCYYTSSDSFVSRTDIIDITTAGYATYPSRFVYDGSNGRIHTAWYLYDGTDRINIYHAYLNLSDGKMYAMDGTDLGATITQAEMASDCLVVNTGGGGYESQTPSLVLDSSNNPHLIYARDTATGWEWQYIYWTGSAWSSPESIVSTDDYRSYGDLYFSNTSVIEAYLTVMNERNGRMEHWRRSSGSWNKVGDVLDPAAYPTHAGGLNHPATVVNGTDGMRWVFCERGLLIDYTIGSYEVFATDSNDTLLSNSLSGNDKDVMQDSTGKYYGKKKSAAEPTETASGKVLEAQTFDASDDYVRFPGGTGVSLAPSPTDAITVEAWAKRPATAASREIYDRGGSTEGYILRITSAGKIQLVIRGGQGSAVGTTDVDDDTFQYLAGTYNKDAGGTKEILVYVGGVEDGDDDFSDPIIYDVDTRASIGSRGDDLNFFGGEIDELRISSIDRSANWLLASSRTVDDPGAFVMLGSEEEAFVTGPFPTFFRA